MNKKWVRILLRRRVLVFSLLVLQLFLMGMTVYHAGLAYQWIYNILNILSVLVVLHIITAKKRSAYKLLWTVTVLLFPLFGGLLYLLISLQKVDKSFQNRISEAAKSAEPYFAKTAPIAASCREQMPEYGGQISFLTKECGFGVYSDTKTDYLSPGEDFFKAMLCDIKKAEKFIFLEYFIISEGRFWSEILEELQKKVKAGVEVRLIYDDMGCFWNLPLDYRKTLEGMGIKTLVFNKFRPALSTLQNNRDHRKITVIDGQIAYTGGANLADEYINEKKRFGHWKDASIRMEGPAAEGFTLLFLSMWQSITGKKEALDRYLTGAPAQSGRKGYLVPFCDSPIDDEYVSEQVYMNLIDSAKDYLYIQTPYLILDDVMVSALIRAAKNGVDVQIITPGIPDKKYVHLTTRSYYKELVASGVKVFEYTPGFIHSKVLCADDKAAVVGTVNLDCRSLYLHFECGVFMCGEESIPAIRRDFEKTRSLCRQMTKENCKCSVFTSVIRSLFRLFAPLL